MCLKGHWNTGLGQFEDKIHVYLLYFALDKLKILQKNAMKTTIICLLVWRTTYLIPYLNFLSLTKKPIFFIPLKTIKS